MTTISFNGNEVKNIGSTNGTSLVILGTDISDENVVIGLNSTANLNKNVVLGDSAYAYTKSIAIGRNGSSLKDGGVAIGTNATVSDNRGIVIGSGTTNNSIGAIALGTSITLTGTNAIALGHVTSTSGNFAIAIGFGQSASADTCSIRNVSGRSGGGSQVLVNSSNVVNTTTSTLASKKNIRKLESVDIMHEAFEPVRFAFNDTNEESIGLIAEYVAEVFPDICTFDENNTPNNIRYDLLSVILCEKVRELELAIKKLE